MKLFLNYFYRSASDERARGKPNNSSDSDDNLPLSKLSKHKKQKRNHKERYKIVNSSSKREKPRSLEELKSTLNTMRSGHSIEECDDGDCSYSDHYPQSLTPTEPNLTQNDQMVKPEERYAISAGPSGSKGVKIEVKKHYSSSSDNYNSD